MSIIEREHAVEVPAVTTRDVLHRAADLLEEFGWCQHDLAKDASDKACDARDGVTFCVGGAYMRALADFGDDLDGFNWNDDLAQLRDSLGIEELHVQFWNDAPGRTKAEVVAKLRSAAEPA